MLEEFEENFPNRVIRFETPETCSPLSPGNGWLVINVSGKPRENY